MNRQFCSISENISVFREKKGEKKLIVLKIFQIFFFLQDKLYLHLEDY